MIISLINVRDIMKYVGRYGKFREFNKYLTPYEYLIREISKHISRNNNNVIAGCFNYVTRMIEYKKDISQYKMKEYWATPLETLKRGMGDCEDSSFLLASLLLAAGVNPRNVRVVLGRSNGEGHAWVEVRADKGWYILESTSADPLRYGVNTWKIREGYRTRYHPWMYIYRDYCEKVRKR